MTDFFSTPGRFYRGNLHTHSTLSDGALEPAEVCRRYRDEGYDFLSLTEHFLGRFGFPIADTSAYRTPGFTTIPGAELHSGAQANGELWHILAVGLPEDFAPAATQEFSAADDQETGPELAARAAGAGAYVSIAHPQWSGLTLDDARSLAAAHSVEAYNHGCAMGADRPDGFHVLEMLLAEGRRLDLIATDDAHFTEPDHFGGWVMVKAAENDPDALMEALKAGTFYSSQGPELHNIVLEDDEIVVESSAVVSMIVQAAGNTAKAVHGLSMTRARMPLHPFAASPWIRVTVIDAAGRRAWSNPIWMG
ncbi:CehA/McbA family metallohydrolase [Psychromarinibacter sp. C21-152]|uniref:CehA/McbA family metallohydrolase n=1 Tax=Psychromarinibacter sediminicola TaxID=3033385 RepID=A0AAE3NR59_9RHOB|nr:CehA/McbA family metallohydrolase [Psychromarinibacter sediminicola]MDF0601993.1 CehA/McbA family metallohydrolase [Psychromarinibacter sediminicola]